MKIEEISSPIFGAVEIHFSKKEHHFFCEYDFTFNDPSDIKRGKYQTFDEAKTEINLNEDNYGKVDSIEQFLAIWLYSSAWPESKDVSGFKMGDEHNRMANNGISIGFDWAHFEQKIVTKKSIIGLGDPYIKNRTVTRDPIIGQKKHTYFRILETATGKSHYQLLKQGRSNWIEGYKIGVSRPNHTFPYSDELLNRLKSIQRSFTDSVERVTNLFAHDSQTLLQHLENVKLLGGG